MTAAGYYDSSYPPSIFAPPVIPATGATAGTPGVFTPSGCEIPIVMTGITASPQTAWTIGQHVITSNSSHWFWDGISWVQGNAP